MTTCRRGIVVAALLVAGCASGTTGGATSDPAPNVVPSEWTAGDDAAAAPPSTPTVAPSPAPEGAAVGVSASRPENDGRATAAAFGQPLPPATAVPEVAQGPTPVALRIPALGIQEALVTAVGVEPDGAMEIPAADEVGWYRFGAGPGDAGSQVLAAHIAADGIDGVFRHLDRLVAGDIVEVVDSDGESHGYEIVGLGTFDKDELPFDLLFDRGGPQRLALITCGGDFNPTLRSYESNVVAFAVPLEA